MDSWPRGARPVADAPRPAGEPLAKAWLVALVARAPLPEAAALPIAAIAREAPGLCDAIVAALRDDGAMARLGPDGDLAPLAARAGVLAGGADPAAAVAAIELLRSVVWGALRADLGGDPDPDLVGDLAERVAAVAAAVTASVLTPRAGVEALDPDLAPVVVLDARAPEREPWRRALDFALARHANAGEPFAVLLVDLDDVERLLAVEAGDELATMADGVERSLRRRLSGGEALVRERIGRWWVIAAGLHRPAAAELAHALAAGVAACDPLHGAPLVASVGLAVCPQDGTDALTLAGHADASMFAARAAGVPLA